MAVRLQDTPRKRLVVILFILSPLAVLAVLCWWMYFALQEGPQMHATPRGAGAGRTGLANEYMGKAPAGEPPARQP